MRGRNGGWTTRLLLGITYTTFYSIRPRKGDAYNSSTCVFQTCGDIHRISSRHRELNLGALDGIQTVCFIPLKALEDPLFQVAPSLTKVYTTLNKKSKVAGRVVTELGKRMTT